MRTRTESRLDGAPNAAYLVVGIVLVVFVVFLAVDILFITGIR